MLNQVVLVGRLTKEIEIKEKEEGKKVAYITIAVPRSFKNSDGVYDTDFIDCILWNGDAERTSEFCKKGDLLGVKGRIQTEIVDDIKSTNIIAEKITFLSSRSDLQKEDK